MGLDPMFKDIVDTDNEQFNIFGSQKMNNTIRYLLRNILLGEKNTKGLWKPPTMPDTIRGNGYIPNNFEPEEHIQAMLDPLFEYDESYMSKEIIGRDQSDTYNVWAYTFTPKEYKKTVVLSAGTHGNEYTAFYFLMQFCQLLVTSWHKIPQLAYMRHNVRVVVVPLINPWGFKNSKRQNSRGVDLNRNCDYLWNEYTSTKGQVGQIYYKGTAPFSEAESKNMRDFFERYKDDMIAYLDFHTITTIDAEQILFTPRHLDQDLTGYADVIRGIKKPTDRVVWGTSAVPSFGNYAAKTYNVSSGNPEWCNMLRSPVNRDSIEMTAAMEYFGNLVTRISMTNRKASLDVLHDKDTTIMTYTNGGSNLIKLSGSAGVWNNFPHTIQSWDIKRHALMKVTGTVEVTVSAATTLSLKLYPYQNYHPDWDFSTNKDSAMFSKTIVCPAAGRYSVDLRSMIHVFPTNYNNGTQRTELAKVRLRGKTTAGTVTLERMEAFIEFDPTNKGFALQILDATGRESFTEDVDDYTRIYPISKFEDEEE